MEPEGTLFYVNQKLELTRSVASDNTYDAAKSAWREMARNVVVIEVKVLEGEWDYLLKSGGSGGSKEEIFYRVRDAYDCEVWVGGDDLATEEIKRQLEGQTLFGGIFEE